MFVPGFNGSKPLSTLKPRVQGIEPSVMIMPATRAAFLRSLPNISIEKLTTFSNTPTMVERAAKYINRKNKLPQTLPRGSAVNTLGSVRNMRLGPLSGDTP